MDPTAVFSRIHLLDSVVAMTHASAWALLAALAVLAGCFTFFRSLLLGNGHDSFQWFVRLFLVVGVLGAYGEIVDTLLAASAGMTSFFADAAGWDDYWSQVSTQFRPLFETGEDSGWDRLLGWMQGGVLSAVVSVTYYLEFMVFDLVNSLSAVFLSILHVFGPLMIAGGIIGQGQSLKQWFSAMVQVLLWPCIPPFLMLLTIKGSTSAIGTDNVAFIICQNVILSLMGLLTPVIVAFVLGRGGVAAFGGAVGGIVMAGITGVASRVASKLHVGSGSHQGADAEASAGAPAGGWMQGDDRPGETSLVGAWQSKRRKGRRSASPSRRPENTFAAWPPAEHTPTIL